MHFRTLLFIVFCNMTTYRGSKIVVSLYAIELGMSQIIIGTLIAMYSVFPMLMGLYAGKLTDRLGVRWPMICGSVGVVCGLSVPYLMPTVTGLYLSATLIGASHVFYHVSAQNMVGLLSAPGTRTRNFSNYGLVMALGGFIGPMLTGFSIDHFGHIRSYLFLALIPLVPAAIVFFGRGLQGVSGAPGEEAMQSANTALLSNQPLRRALFAGAAVLTGTDLFQFYMPIYGHSIGLSASAIGVILSMVAAAAFLVRLVVPTLTRRWGAEPVLVCSIFIAAAIYLLFPFFTNPYVLAGIAFMLGLGLGCSQPLTMMLTYTRAPQGRSGEALGLRLTINNSMHIGVPIVFGAIGSAFGFMPVFFANAALLAGGGVFVNRGRR